MFLEGPLWEAACDNAYSDHVPFLVAAIEHLTGCSVHRIEGDLPESRSDIFGLSVGESQCAPERRVIPIGVSHA
jgi:hypothetical protein